MRLPFPVSRAARLHLVEQWPALAAAVRVNLGRARSVTLDLPEAFVDHLIELGYLRQADREDRHQVMLALHRFLDYSALGDVHP
jgi:hypothetical protein